MRYFGSLSVLVLLVVLVAQHTVALTGPLAFCWIDGEGRRDMMGGSSSDKAKGAIERYSSQQAVAEGKGRSKISCSQHCHSEYRCQT